MLRRLHLDLSGLAAPLARLAREFPTIAVAPLREAPPGAPVIAVERWRDASFEPYAYERVVGDATAGVGDALVLAGGLAREREDVALEVLTRWQGALDRRNAHSRGALFDAILARHRALHDTAKPLVRADYNHALDVWQWVLRLAPAASFELQVAALFHDVERLVSEPDRRVEQHAADYQAFKDAHARGGAAMAAACLAGAGCPEGASRRVAELVSTHERAGGDEERALLADADALSFFSLNSAGFLSYYGPVHTRKKVAYSLARLRPAARERLVEVRLVAGLASMVVAELLALGGARAAVAQGSQAASLQGESR